jgi:hypothetical protein
MSIYVNYSIVYKKCFANCTASRVALKKGLSENTKIHIFFVFRSFPLYEYDMLSLEEFCWRNLAISKQIGYHVYCVASSDLGSKDSGSGPGND